MGRTAFVTGADGFVGLNLTKELLKHGWQVFAFCLPACTSPHLEEMRVTILRGDITDKQSLLTAFPEHVDAVFHLAADTSLRSSENKKQNKVNVLGTRNVVEVALEKKAGRFIHMSSVAVFGFHERHIHEQTPSNVYNSNINYFKSKALAEEEVLRGINNGLDAVILSPGNIIGPYDTSGWAQIFIKIKEDQFSGIGNGGGSFCHVFEVAKVMREAVDKGKTGERYVLGGEDASFHELAVKTQQLIGGNVPDKPVSSAMMHLLSWIVIFFCTLRGKTPFLTPEIATLSSNWLCVDATKAEQELGYRKHSLEEMIQDSYQWLSSQNIC
ncbi:MAG: NAD-dependent epimerase/dehydratase family protein [Bacteroidota bacterium]